MEIRGSTDRLRQLIADQVEDIRQAGGQVYCVAGDFGGLADKLADRTWPDIRALIENVDVHAPAEVLVLVSDVIVAGADLRQVHAFGERAAGSRIQFVVVTRLSEVPGAAPLVSIITQDEQQRPADVRYDVPTFDFTTAEHVLRLFKEIDDEICRREGLKKVDPGGWVPPIAWGG